MTEALRSELVDLCAAKGLQLEALPSDGKCTCSLEQFGLCALAESMATPESRDGILRLIVDSFMLTHAHEHKEGCQWMVDVRSDSGPLDGNEGGPVLDFYIFVLFCRRPAQQEATTDKAQVVAVA
jgi:hypothetical protein